MIQSIQDIVNGVTALPSNPGFEMQFGDDSVKGSGNLRGTPQPTYNRVEIQQAAAAIRATGQRLQEGNKFYDTGNPELNKELYGPDISRNLAGGDPGFRTPRQFDTDFGDYLGSFTKNLVKQIALSAATGGAGLFNTVGAIGQGAQGIRSAAEAANTIYNLSTDTVGDAERRAPRDNSSITNTIFGNEFGDFGPIFDARGPGGLLDMVTVDRPAAPSMNPNPGGSPGSPANEGSAGGQPGGPLSESTGPAPPELLPGGSGDQAMGEEEDRWIWDGTVLVSESTGERRQVPNPSRLEVGRVYNGDAEPIGDDPMEDLYAGIGGLTEEDETNALVNPILGAIPTMNGMGAGGTQAGAGGLGGSQVGNQTGQFPSPGAQAGIIGNQTGMQPGIPAMNGMGPDGTQAGAGSGSGVGTGSGSGNGSGDGSGMQNALAQSGFGGIAGGGGSSDLFPYSQIAPSQAAELRGLMDYVASLRGQ